MNVAVCLPTYNERDNLEPLVGRVLEVLPEARLYVIDDASPDGTGQVADRLAAADVRIAVLHRPGKAGLGPAYVAGFRRALADGAEIVFEMDADFSHDPAAIPFLIDALADADVVIGSRYVAGGRIETWGPVRRGVSRAGATYARVVLGVPVRDLTAGFKCFRREVLETVDLDAVSSVGYAFQIELTYRALRAGFRVVEVPIVFTDRVQGGSKMSRRIVLEAIVKVPALRLAAARSRLEPPL